MDAYMVPAKDSEIEYIERRSRFIGRLWLAQSEQAALENVNAVRERHRDATHNVYAYIIMNGATRCSDDGEPGGTAGIPVLEVFRRAGVVNVCCVVTRYFGGILLGAGGLVRAYSTAARLALEASGIKEMRPMSVVRVKLPYNLLDRVKILVASFGGEIKDAGYAKDIELLIELPSADVTGFEDRLRDLSGGTIFL